LSRDNSAGFATAAAAMAGTAQAGACCGGGEGRSRERRARTAGFLLQKGFLQNQTRNYTPLRRAPRI